MAGLDLAFEEAYELQSEQFELGTSVTLEVMARHTPTVAFMIITHEVDERRPLRFERATPDQMRAVLSAEPFTAATILFENTLFNRGPALSEILLPDSAVDLDTIGNRSFLESVQTFFVTHRYTQPVGLD